MGAWLAMVGILGCILFVMFILAACRLSATYDQQEAETFSLIDDSLEQV